MTPQEAAQTGRGGSHNRPFLARNKALWAGNDLFSPRNDAVRLRNDLFCSRNSQDSPCTGLVRPGTGALSVRNGWLSPGTTITAVLFRLR